MRFSAVSGLSHTRIRCRWCGRKFPSIWVLWGFAAGGDGRWMVGPHEPSVAFWGKIHYLLHLPTPMVIATKKKPFGGKKKKNLHRCRKHLCVNFSSSPATSSPASAARVIPPAFPTPFPSRCQNQGGGWERGGSAGVPTTMKSSFGGGWQGGLILFIRAQALYSHGFLTRHPVNSRIPQTEEALAYLYCVLALAP